MSDIFTSYEGEWAFVKAGNDRFIGRVIYEQQGHDVSNIIEYVNKKTITLQPAFTYIAEYVQTQEGGISRQLIVVPVELCVGFDSKVRLNNVDWVILFGEMSGEDEKEFKRAVRTGVDMVMESRAAKAGITLETSGSAKGKGILLR